MLLPEVLQVQEQQLVLLVVRLQRLDQVLEQLRLRAEERS
jgi:hypothetical protein